ncbi:MAG: iron-containing alcohol dehydrogenase, partial [Rikenellaceae bacterium]
MNKFEYYNPVRVIFGAGELNSLGSHAKALGQRVCVVSYRELLFLTPVIERVVRLLEDQGLEVFPFYEIEANPEIGVVERGARMCKENNVDLVIGVGGGSAMDAA